MGNSVVRKQIFPIFSLIVAVFILKMNLCLFLNLQMNLYFFKKKGAIGGFFKSIGEFLDSIGGFFETIGEFHSSIGESKKTAIH